MNTTMQKNEEHILRRAEQIKEVHIRMWNSSRTYEKHQEVLCKINKRNEIRHKKGVVESDYLKMKRQLNKYKERAGEFKQQGE